jgi:RNA polymerase sigma factor (sigma-70 family)
MMEAVQVQVPPFERFYEEQQSVVLAQLRRMLGRDAADDAFQETFLRALRAYPTLEHGRHLRAWALTIARNVALDFLRRDRSTSAEVPDLESVDEPLPYEEVRRLTAELPQKERAAVFLRYGYDLSYDDIGAAIGSSPEAARQAASSGVRRLRRKEQS